MKKCIEEIMAMDKDQVDEMIERGHDWASDHISSSKDDLQEVCDWLRYEIETHQGEEGEEDPEEIVDIDVEGNDENDDEEEEGEEGEEDEEDEEGEEDEEDDKKLESKEPKYSYTEEKN